MKQIALTIYISLLLACNLQSGANMESFWVDFQKAVAANNKEAVANKVLFPLGGSDTFGENIRAEGMTRAQFLEWYDQIFDKKVKTAIAQTKVADLAKSMSPTDTALEALKLPSNTTVYNLTVFYIFDEGLETQTESAITFYFLQQKNEVKLAYLSVAG